MQDQPTQPLKKQSRKRVPEINRPLVLGSVCERDIDLLIVEEMICSKSLQRLIFETVAPPTRDWIWSDKITVQVRHSVVQKGGSTNGRVVPPSGETDIEVVFDLPSSTDSLASGRHRLVCLIENKIEAAFMPRQPKRYLARATTKRESGECLDARTLIMAPNEYQTKVPGDGDLNATLSYEEMAALFAEHGSP
jgi:hypothetical protein